MDELDLLRTDEFDNTIPPTKWDLFEALDRVSIQMNQLSDALCDHQGLNDEQAKMASQAFSLLFEVYQIAGDRFFEATKDED
jgi:hypothetical protein